MGAVMTYRIINMSYSQLKMTMCEMKQANLVVKKMKDSLGKKHKICCILLIRNPPQTPLNH